MFVVGIVAVLLLIGLLVLCKMVILKRCCTCFQKLVAFAMAKLMFNSVLRSALQAYLVLSLSSMYSYQQVSTETNERRIDLAMLILMSVLLVLFPILTIAVLRCK